MTESLHQPIDYDVRKIWHADRRWSARRLVPADTLGLDLIRKHEPIVELVASRNSVGEQNLEQLSWVLESRHRLVGCVDARVGYMETPETPHPWSRTTPGALETCTDLPSLSLECVFWTERARLAPVAILRDVALNAVQRRAFTEARVELAFEPGPCGPEEWLMRTHADFENAAHDADPIAAFLKAGFYLQGYYQGASDGCIARLNWPNRAH